MRTTVVVIALSVGGLSALWAIEARAETTAWKTGLQPPPCAEGRALLAAKLAYLEARISPGPDQQDPWRTFANAIRASADGFDRLCAEEPLRPESADAGERLERMQGHAAAMQAMFGALAKAYEAIAPVLTPAQRDILSRNIVPVAADPGILPATACRPWATAARRGHGPELQPKPTGIAGGSVGTPAVLIYECRPFPRSERMRRDHIRLCKRH